jgi:hypothetical protein
MLRSTRWGITAPVPGRRGGRTAGGEMNADPRVRRALAQCDLLIDIYSAWLGRYEDDDRHADIDWIMAIVPEMEATEQRRRGWLCVSGTGTPGIGWQLDDHGWLVGSLCGSMRGYPYTRLTRGQFRAAAKASGVSLPSRHATLYLDQACGGER